MESMAIQRKSRIPTPQRPPAKELNRLETWKLEDAKFRLSEVVRRASTHGPQLVTVRGKEAAVILSPDEFARLRPAKQMKPLVAFLQDLGLDKVELVREPDYGRDVDR
jgi:antitoxin Phd